MQNVHLLKLVLLLVYKCSSKICMPFGFIHQFFRSSYLFTVLHGRPSNTFNNISIEIFKAEVVYSFKLLLCIYFLFYVQVFSLALPSRDLTLVYSIVYSMYPFMYVCICLYKYTRISFLLACIHVCVYVLCSMFYVILHREFKSRFEFRARGIS